jgi:hypothetical protein
VLERAPAIVEAHAHGQIHPPRRRFRPLPHQLGQPCQRLLQAHRQEVHVLLHARNDLLRIAQSRRTCRAIEAMPPPRDGRPGPQP